MAEHGPWRGDAIRRGLAVELGEDTADHLQALVDDAIEKIDGGITFDPPEDRNNALAFFALCIGGHMREEPEGDGS